ncbi:MAG: hypothetical protein R3C26_05595 [Calditrichia bacterium]
MRQFPTGRNGCNFKGWIVYGTNRCLTLPQPKKTIEAIQNLDLLVAIDLMPAEITGYAGCCAAGMFLSERYSDDLRIFTRTRAPPSRCAHRRSSRVSIPKPGWWITRELGLKLGLGEYFPWDNIEDYLDDQLKLDRFQPRGNEGKGVLTLPDRYPLYFEDGVAPEFNTPSGKIELASETLRAYGFDAVPKYTHHEEPPNGYFRLFTVAHRCTLGRTTNNPLLAELMPENEVWINTDVAKLYGIKNGEYVVLVNHRTV